MKKIAIYRNSHTASIQLASKVKEKLVQAGFICQEGLLNPDYVLSIGGDGTLLGAFHAYEDHMDRVQFLGLHTGHLGFYTDWLPDEFDRMIDSLVQNRMKETSYPLLEVKLYFQDQTIERRLALNEVALRSFGKTMVCDVSIKDVFFETFRGDGLCVATPTGSTGLNKSLGGAVLHPCVEAIQMTEMASVNNRLFRTLASPIILPKQEWLDLYPQEADVPLSLSIDHLFRDRCQIERLRLQMAQERVHFVYAKHLHYWDRVEASFIGHRQVDKPPLQGDKSWN